MISSLHLFLLVRDLQTSLTFIICPKFEIMIILMSLTMQPKEIKRKLVSKINKRNHSTNIAGSLQCNLSAITITARQQFSSLCRATPSAQEKLGSTTAPSPAVHGLQFFLNYFKTLSISPANANLQTHDFPICGLALYSDQPEWSRPGTHKAENDWTTTGRGDVFSLKW